VIAGPPRIATRADLQDAQQSRGGPASFSGPAGQLLEIEASLKLGAKHWPDGLCRDGLVGCSPR